MTPLTGKVSCAEIEKLKSIPKDINLQLHNYSPPPKIPFVFNLASLNKDISTINIAIADNLWDYFSRFSVNN